MKKSFKLLLVALVMGCVVNVASAQTELIPASARKIHYGGSVQLVQQGDSVLLNRHSEALFAKADCRINRDKAITSSGIYIEFESDSQSVEMLFSDQEKGTYRTPLLGVYKDGEPQEVISMRDGVVLTNDSGERVTWRVYMPIMYSCSFNGLVVDQGSKLYKVRGSKSPVYLAIGDSITHGVGQAGVSSDKTYAGILASIKGWNMYNVAVGGSQITPSIADEFSDLKADYITILWGYNDWNSGSCTLDEIEERYSKLLTKLRANQKRAEIFVVTPTYTKTIERKNGDTQTPISMVKERQERVVKAMQSAGDRKIHLIDGAKISKAEDLKDVVHFNTPGAESFGTKLAELIEF